MKNFKKNKTNLLAVAVFLLVVIGYKVVIESDAIPPDDTAARDIGSDLIETLEKLESITFDQTILSSPAYRALIDTGAPVPESPVGRPNPFAPFGQN